MFLLGSERTAKVFLHEHITAELSLCSAVGKTSSPLRGDVRRIIMEGFVEMGSSLSDLAPHLLQKDKVPTFHSIE